MSNPGSPAVSSGGSNNGVSQSQTTAQSDDDKGNGVENSGTSSSKDSSSVAPHLDPVVRLNPFEISDAQLRAMKRKPSVDKKAVKSSSSGSVAEIAVSETEKSVSAMGDLKEVKKEVAEDDTVQKPRRLSVHFAPTLVETEPNRPKLTTTMADRPKPESGGSGSRKHRSRKEKLVCRSESPTEMGLPTTSGSQNLSSINIPLPVMSTTSGTSGRSTPIQAVPPPVIKESYVSLTQSDSIAPPPIVTKPPPVVATITSARKTPTPPASRPHKTPVKRTNSASHASGGSRRNSPMTLLSGSGVSVGSGSASFKEPVKKKKVIEIVSPRRRKMDYIDLLKTSSDPICVRATHSNRFKNKSHRNRLKFSRGHFNKSNQSGSHRMRRESLQQNSMGAVINKQRMSFSPIKKEVEETTWPSTVVDDLLWTLEEADKEFYRQESSAPTTPSTSSQPGTLDPLASSSFGSTSTLPFGRRRVESEPASAGSFERAPSSPSGSQSFYHLRKEIYFSPSPSYAATGPTGRRRYSRRRHARIHPPFDNTNCSFQGHHCPNTKTPGSQYCEKHLDQGPTAGYSHCRFMKDGRQCGAIYPSYDPAVTFCEEHACHVAKSEYEKRIPPPHPDAAKNIIAKMSKILSEGLVKADTEKVETSTPVILQISEEPDILQEFPLGRYTGGQLEECDSEGERNVNPEKPDYDTLKNAGYYTTEEVIQIHINKLRKLKALYTREKELEWLTRQHKFRFLKDGLDKLKHFGPRFTTNPYLIDKLSTDVSKEYMDHQIKQYEAAKAILQSAYTRDGQRGLLRLKMLKKVQELEKMAKATGQKQHDAFDIYDSETDADSDSGEPRDRRESSRLTGTKSSKCAYNEGYAIRACPNPPVYRSHYCFKHILSDTKQVQWVPCNRRIGPDAVQDVCKTPVFKILEKSGCAIHAPLVLSKHKLLRRSEEDLTALADTDDEEEEIQLEGETEILESLVTDECISVPHLDEALAKLSNRRCLDITDTSDSEETDEEGAVAGPYIPSPEERLSPKPNSSL
ncbi:unnamed protein product [Orchesella dallaii]